MNLILPPSIETGEFYLMIGEIFIIKVNDINGIPSKLPFTRNNIKFVTEPDSEPVTLSDTVSQRQV